MPGVFIFIFHEPLLRDVRCKCFNNKKILARAQPICSGRHSRGTP